MGARTIFWNGPVGCAELEKFSYGSSVVSTLCASLAEKGRTAIVAGKDTIEVVEKNEQRNSMTHVSTGAASAMDLLERKILPGLDCLNPAQETRIAPVNENVPLFDLDKELGPLELKKREIAMDEE